MLIQRYVSSYPRVVIRTQMSQSLCVCVFFFLVTFLSFVYIVFTERAIKHMKTWAYIGSNEVCMNNMDLVSEVFAVVANLTNMTNVPITNGKSLIAASSVPAVEQEVTFNAGDIAACREELKSIADKHRMLFFPI